MPSATVAVATMVRSAERLGAPHPSRKRASRAQYSRSNPPRPNATIVQQNRVWHELHELRLNIPSTRAAGPAVALCAPRGEVGLQGKLSLLRFFGLPAGGTDAKHFVTRETEILQPVENRLGRSGVELAREPVSLAEEAERKIRIIAVIAESVAGFVVFPRPEFQDGTPGRLEPNRRLLLAEVINGFRRHSRIVLKSREYGLNHFADLVGKWILRNCRF